MGSVESIKQVISIIRKPQKDARIAAVVVSAMSGVTDELIAIGILATKKDLAYKKRLAELERKHTEALRKLVGRRNRARSIRNLRNFLTYLHETMMGISLVRELSPGALDYIMSYGERLSAHILVEALNDRGVPCEYLNARKIIRTDDNFGAASVDFKVTNKTIKNYFRAHKKLQIVTGFIGATKDNKTTTLGRGGSDYSAAIVGAALVAHVIEIWTDVSGVYTADPRIVKNALPIASMKYSEAVEMSYFGAKVIHPPTMRPAREKNIPILIKNTFEPAAPGTIVSKKFDASGKGAAKGISSVRNIAMLQVEGDILELDRGGSGRIFRALARAKVNVMLITQASSQHSISFAVLSKDAERAQGAIEEEFALERAQRLMRNVFVQDELAIIAVVGEGMRHQSGIAGRLFGTLGKSGVNVVAIAQGSSELNISVVVDAALEAKALNAVHTAFFFPETKHANIFLIGTGLIGGTLLRQISAQRESLWREYGFDITVMGITNAERMLIDENGIDATQWKTALARKGKRPDLPTFIRAMKAVDAPGKVFVDCTASDAVAATYADVLRSRISVVTPNKRANSGSMAYFRELQALAKQPGTSFLYETNACAALPVISMLDDLVLSGDRIRKIEGVLSGTLSYLFSAFTGKTRFSEVVLEAKRRGYTEPDPREDLKGTDVARKILILARKCGLSLELSDVKVESLVSARAKRAKTIDAFLGSLKREDAAWEKRRRAAEKAGKRLRYIATLEKGRARVELKAVPPTHPFYELSGSDNIVAVTSNWYSKTPLVVKGPGAGGDVTAAGVFADILRVARDAA